MAERLGNGLLSTTHVNVECRLHVHASMEIVLVLDGVLQMTVSGTQYTIREGQGIFVAPFEAHSFHSAEPNRCRVLEFSRELTPHFFEFLQSNRPNTHLFAVCEESASLCRRLLPDGGGAIDLIGVQAALSPLCYDVLLGCRFESSRGVNDSILEQSFDYVDRHFQEDLTLESVARAIGVHPVTLCKSFSKNTGVGFRSYLQYLRSSFAAHLICTTEKSLSEIAYEAGFGSIRSFNRAFLQTYCTTPSQYRIDFAQSRMP